MCVVVGERGTTHFYCISRKRKKLTFKYAEAQYISLGNRCSFSWEVYFLILYILPWVLVLERAEINETCSEVATEVKIMEYILDDDVKRVTFQTNHTSPFLNHSPNIGN